MFAPWLRASARSSVVRRPFRRPILKNTKPLVEALEDRFAPALVAAYSFNEGAGTSVADASGNGNAGAIASATWSTAGQYGNALSFNGTSARVNINDSASLHLTTAMTLEAWVKPTAVDSAWRDVIYKGNDNYYLSGTSTNSSRPVGGGIVSGSYSEAIGAAALPTNTWTHLATTFDGATMRLYVNGVQVATQARAGSLATSSNQLQIGGDSIYGQYFSGLIDEVRIYDNVLSAAQIQTDMNTPVTSGPDATPPTVTVSSPTAGATGVAVSANVTATFSEAMDPATINTNTIELRDPGNALVAAAVSYDSATHIATLDPTGVLAPGTVYNLVAHGGTADPRVKDVAGNALAANFTASFTTAPLSLTISDASVVEGNSGSTNAVFTVTLSAASAQTVTVTYATADGTATAGSDYTTIPPTVLTFDPGQVSKSIPVAVLGDTVSESNETFFVNLSNPTSAVIADAQGVGTIVEDDAVFIGSEGFGYSAFTNPFENLDLVPGAPGVTTIRSTGDNNTNTIILTTGNTFNFYGTSYTSLIVSTNGLITFGSANTSGSNANLTSSPSQRSIAPLWDDWINTTGNAMLLDKYEDTNADGTYDRLIFEWNNVQAGPTSPSPVTFQAILQLNTGATPGAITFNYPDLDSGAADSHTNGTSATVGIKDTGTQGARRLLVSFNAASVYVSSGKAIRIVPDTTPPTVAMTAPADGATVTGTITLTASATDNISVAGVQFILDGTNLGAEDTTAPYSFSWNTATALRGAHTLSAKARDAAGNVTTTASLTVTVVPQLVITAPANNAAIAGPTITVHYVTTGNLTGIDHAQFTLDNDPQAIHDFDFDGSLSLSNVAPGAHVLTGLLVGANLAPVLGTDAAPIYFTVLASDTTPPSVAITAPTNGANIAGTVSLTATASDDVGVAGVQFLIDGVAVGAEDTTAPYTISWNSSTVGNGSHTVSARARDAAANSTVSSVVTINVANANDPAVIGQWSSLINWPLVAINMVLLNNGKILMWDGGPSCIGSESVRIWDPATNLFTAVPIPDPNGVTDIFCSGMTALADGRVLIVGGHECNDPNYVGQANAYIFDPVALHWTVMLNVMTYRRWYPTVTLLADGRALVTSGSDQLVNSYDPIPEVFDPRTNTFTALNSANLTIGNYPFMFVLPNGNVLAAGSDEHTMPTYVLNVATQTWSVVDPTTLDAGSAVMYLPGKIMKAGSSYRTPDSVNVGPSAATTYVIDMTQSTPMWQQTVSMAYARTHLNLTLLPDDKVIAIGGSSQIDGFYANEKVLPTEMWSPATQAWSTMASIAEPRMYHSTALLLPDGRVLSAGGGRNGVSTADYLDAQIYSPPYLFKGARPTITSAPTTLSYNSGFFLATPDAASIASVALIRNGSDTHANNMDQRYVPLTFTQGTGGLNVQAPANANLAPPGYYMLFIVNSNGVPSIAPFVRFPAVYEDSQPPSAPTNLAATGGVGTAVLSWNAATDNTGVVRYDVYRSTTSGFTPSAANQIGQPTTTSATDTGLAAGTYYYRVAAEDAAGNIGALSNEASATVLADTVPPSVSVTNPANAATVSGSITVDATALDDVAIAGVQFLLDTNNLGAEDTVAPFSISWNTVSTINGTHTLAARARDTGGNVTTSATVAVTVSNAAPNGLVLAMGFNEGSGATVSDASGNGNNGSISNATWVTAGEYGKALSFNGNNARVNINDSVSLHLTTGMTLEAWVNPSAVTSAWRDVVYKGNDNYYLSGTSNNGGAPVGGVIANGAYAEAIGTTPLGVNTWTYLATTYDGNTVRLYINGTLVSSQAHSGTILTSTNQLQIGGDSIYGQYFSGLIDEVRVYNRALSATEVQNDMNTPIGSPMALLGPAVAGAHTASLRPTQIRPLVAEAIRRWATVLGEAAVQRLRGVQVQVMDLPGTTLGLASGSVIFIDKNAAGHGWFVDPTPKSDSEFARGRTKRPAAGRADLLTVLTHEFGHVLGWQDDAAANPFAGNIMGGLLPLGVRRIQFAGLPHGSGTTSAGHAAGNAPHRSSHALDALWAEFGAEESVTHGQGRRRHASTR